MQVKDAKTNTASEHPSLNPPLGSIASPAAAAAAAQGATRPPFPFAFPTPPDPSDLVPIVIPPWSKSSQKQQEPKTTAATAFIFLPGAFMYPKDYAALSEQLQSAFKTIYTDKNIPIWLILAAVDWTKLNPAAPGEQKEFNQAINTALEAAESAGFTKNSSNPSGRLDNVFIGMHSMSVLAAAGFAFHNSAGVVLFGASLVPTNTFWPSVRTFPRPIMHIFGEMDGQTHLCRAALTAAEAAVSAPSLGRKAAARESPIALIEGMNHAQFSNNKVNYARGDLEPFEKEQNIALKEVAAVVAAFLTAHLSTTTSTTSQQESALQNAKVEAIDVLLDVTMHAARHFTPYLRALGRTAAEDLFMCTQGACIHGEDMAHPFAHSHGAEYIWFDSPYCAFTAHPGELHTAVHTAMKAQKQLLTAAGFSSELVSSIPIAATAHTSKETFVHSQPVILQSSDAPHGFVVKVHVLLEREAYPEGGLAVKLKGPVAAMVSPSYSLKLKSGEQIAYAVKEMSSSVQNPDQLIKNTAQHKEKYLSSAGGGGDRGGGGGSRLAAELYEEALVQVGARAREIFQKRGFELDFKGSSPRGSNATEEKEEVKKTQHGKISDWLNTPILLTKDPHHSASVSSIESSENKITSTSRVCTALLPSVQVPAKEQGPFDEGPSRFAGAAYFKMPSLAWCMEWILVAGLRSEID
jgi:hypothetical protein